MWERRVQADFMVVVTVGGGGGGGGTGGTVRAAGGGGDLGRSPHRLHTSCCLTPRQQGGAGRQAECRVCVTRALGLTQPLKSIHRPASIPSGGGRRRHNTPL